MEEPLIIRVYEVIGSGFCVASGDGEKIFERIQATINAHKKVVLSFLNVTTLTSAFLNTAIGQLYGVMEEKIIESSLSYSDMEEDDRILLLRVIETAKAYFANPERQQNLSDTLFNSDDE